MGYLDENEMDLIAGARRRGVKEKAKPSDRSADKASLDDDEASAEGKVIELDQDPQSDMIDIDRDPAPELPKLITLPRDLVLATLRDVQDLSFRRALWARRPHFKGWRSGA